MQNPWKLPGSASVLSPLPSAAGALVLSSTSETELVDVTMTLQSESPEKINSTTTGHQTGPASDLLSASQTGLPLFGSIPKTILSNENNIFTNPNSNFLLTTHLTVDCSVQEPKSSSPLLTNKAASSPTLPPTTGQTEATKNTPSPPILPPPFPQAHLQSKRPSLVERLRISEDKTLQRLAPVSISATGRPRVLIPDDVFEKGAEIHKDFIVCYYNGKPPPFNQIQSVFNHMWEKGKKLEIHNNLSTDRHWLEFLVITCVKKSLRSVSAIRIWAHLTGVPLDLRYNHGLSLVAGLVGEPKETNDFTRNLVSLTISHVKVEVDLTKPLPSVVEFEHQSANLPLENSPAKAHVQLSVASFQPLPSSASTPDPPPRPSLKRSRSSPTLSPQNPSQTPNPNPFFQKNLEPIKLPPFHQNPPDLSSSPNCSTKLLSLDPQDWLHTNKPLFGAILESHIKELSLLHLMTKLCSGWSFVSNHHSDDDGRIILIWKDPMKLQVVHQSRQTLTCLLTLPDKEPLFYTAVYASNLAEERIDLWTDLLQLHSTFDLQSKMWLVGGDFNQILFPLEHSSPSVNTRNHQMYLFHDCLLQTGLFDLRFNGPNHTWKNNQPESPIAKKLDRQLVNNNVISSFPHAVATFLPPSVSDHTPCLTDLAYQLPKAGTQPFKFQNYLTKHPGFTQLITDAWAQAGGICCNLADLCWKLKIIKKDLKLLNRDNYSKIQERVKETYCLLQTVQVQALQSPTPQIFREERDLNQRWMFLRQIEECYFRQKSWINWLREGDLNTTYFHRICQVRASYNAIRVFITSTGALITDPLEMSQHAIAHFHFQKTSFYAS
uniref:Uncharacterized protein n=1 Tax=Brassica oleracea var. oleracea TaxID=109376 RepID=A0A0D3CI77_BRAOL